MRLTGPARLFGLPLMMPVSITRPVSSSSVSVPVPLGAAAPLTAALLPTQVKEELSGRLLERIRQEGTRRGVTFQNKSAYTSTVVETEDVSTSSSAAAAAAAIALLGLVFGFFCLLILSLAACLYGFSVTSWGCFTSSDGSMVFIGMMLKAYKYCSGQKETRRTSERMTGFLCLFKAKKAHAPSSLQGC